VADECAGRFAVPSIPDGHKCFVAVFVFALPAGVVSDLVNRQKLLIATYLWLAVAAALLAISTWFNHISFSQRLFCSVSALPLALLSGRQLFLRSFRKVNWLQRLF
jgi:MFS family permease